MELKDLSPIFLLLAGVGILFGTFVNFQTNTPFGFDWFVNMLWFAVGFPVLLGIVSLLFAALTKGEEAIMKK